jgi:hypothetical protein
MALVAALCAVVVLWGIHISSALGPTANRVVSIPSPTSSSVVPHIVTDYTSDHTGRANLLCAELSPGAGTVQVETTTGELITTLHCPQK